MHSQVKFVADYKTIFDNIEPSFFEWTVGLAFHYFAEQEVDIAIIEVGLGGRLDSTNVIGEYGLICLNGRMNTTGLVDFGGLLRFDSNSAESINLQKLGAMGVQHLFSSGHYGLRVGEITSNTNPIKFYSSATVQTHSDSILPLY